MASLEILQGSRNKLKRLSGEPNGRKVFSIFDPEVQFNRDKYERCGSIFEYCLKQNIVDDIAYDANAKRLKEQQRNQEVENERQAYIKANTPPPPPSFFEANKGALVMGGVGLIIFLVL